MARREGNATNRQSLKVARLRGASPSAETQTLGTLSGLPTLALQNVLQILGDDELLRIRAVSRGVATAAGPLILELRVALSPSWGLKAGGKGGTFQLNRGRAGFCSLFHMVDNVCKVKVNIMHCATSGCQMVGWVVTGFLTKFMNQPSLRDFKLQSKSRLPQALVLRLLPACADNLEALALQFPLFSHDFDLEQFLAEQKALRGAVRNCQFPRLQALWLEGTVLSEGGGCPLGLLTIWERDPQALTRLHHAHFKAHCPDNLPPDSPWRTFG